MSGECWEHGNGWIAYEVLEGKNEEMSLRGICEECPMMWKKLSNAWEGVWLAFVNIGM